MSSAPPFLVLLAAAASHDKTSQISTEQSRKPDTFSNVEYNATPALPPGIPLAEFPPLSTLRATESHERATQTVIAAINATKVPKVIPAVPRRPEQAASVIDENAGGEKTVSIAREESHLANEHVIRGEQISPKIVSNADEHEKEVGKSAKESPAKKRLDGSEKVLKASSIETAPPKEPSQKQAQTVNRVEAAAKTSSKGDSTTPGDNQAAVISTPTIAAPPPTSSPASRPPRTLRLVQSTEPENTQSQGSANGNPASVLVTSAHKKPHDRSVLQPSTPSRETPSASVSTTSNSASRTTSPTRAESTAVAKHKSKQPKKEAPKPKPSEERKPQPETKAVAEEIVQAPIIGRKKKTKKPKAQTTARATLDSQPQSPAALDTVSTDAPAEETKADWASEVVETGALGSENEDVDLLPKIMKLPSLAAVIEYLKQQGDFDPGQLETYMNTTSFDIRPPQFIDDPTEVTTLDIKLNKQDIATLDNTGKPILVHLSEQEAAIVLPNHAVLRHLSHDEASLYLTTWERTIENDPGALKSLDHPYAYIMDSAWRRCLRANLLSMGFSMMPHGAMAEQLSLSALSPRYDSRFPYSTTDALPSHGPEPPPFTSQMDNMSLEEAAQAVELSADMKIQHRKAAEVEERKLLGLVKKNRKALKEAIQV